MNSRAFFDKVALMRRLQKEYFKTRSKSVLEQCKVVGKNKREMRKNFSYKYIEKERIFKKLLSTN